jgi:antitoxin PrlF
MGRKTKKEMTPMCCDQTINLKVSNCKVEAMVSVDERGQMVLPKELREKAGIKPGDKMVALSWFKEGEVYCVSLIKADYFMGILNDMLGPMMDELAIKK